MRLPVVPSLLLGAALAGAAPVAAQVGLTPVQRARLARVERVLAAAPDTAVLRRHVRTLAAEPHVAGTPAQRATADYVLRELAALGLDTFRVAYTVHLPVPDSTTVERLTATRERLTLEEPPLAADPTSAQRPWPAMNGHSGAGDVTAPVVYVNYGLADDYAQLARLGVDVRGKVALARYGRSFRGIKAREAERAGAAALLLYSEPQDDGFFVGDTYPDGPMRHPDAVQRGSIYNDRGDPSTPGWPSVDGARRLPPDSMSVARIPVVPIGYRNAEGFLRALRGPSVPQPWQGALAFRYHVGGTDDVRARVAVWPEQGDRAFKRIENTFALLHGTDWPDEWVITGGHRDAWGPGALDNVSGVATILEAARAWATAARQGLRPRRTLVFATWDAEEWGLVGSSEYAEQEAQALVERTVAYLNQDVTAQGRAFNASATASLHRLVREVAAEVRQPGDTGSVLAAWQRRTGRLEPPLGDLGGGSDFAGFYNHLGIPSFDFGFGGPAGVYHSAYDTWTFVERFADPGYLAHRQAAELNARLLARLSEADVVPLDPAGLGRDLARLIERVRREGRDVGTAVDVAPLEAAAARLVAAGDRFAEVRDAALARRVTRTQLTRTNRLLRQVEPALARPEGIPGRPWMRNLLFASDRDDGYGNTPMPGVVEALRDGDAARAAAEVADLAARLVRAAALVEAAAAELGGT